MSPRTRRRAAEWEAALPGLRADLRLAEARATSNRVRLLLEGTTPKQAQAAAAAARSRFHQAADAAATARGQAAALARQAQTARHRRARAQAEEARRMAAIEPLALEQGLTRAELRALTPQERESLHTQATTRWSWPAHRPSKISAPPPRQPRRPTPPNPQSTGRPLPTTQPRPRRGLGR